MARHRELHVRADDRTPEASGVPQTSHFLPVPSEAFWRSRFAGPAATGPDPAGAAEGVQIAFFTPVLHARGAEFQGMPAATTRPRPPSAAANHFPGTVRPRSVVTFTEATMDGQAATDVTKRPDLTRWTNDPNEFPTMRALSAGLMFFSRVLVHNGPAARLEFVSFEMPRQGGPDSEGTFVVSKLMEWNAQWEAGPYRAFDTDELPNALAFLRDIEALDKPPSSDIVLVPREHDNIYQRWSPLYHLLPRQTLVRFGLPIIHRGVWPLIGAAWGRERIRPEQGGVLAEAVAQHLWSHGLGRAKSPLLAFSKDDSLKLLSHDLGFWRAQMEILLRKYGRDRGRVERDDADTDPESIPTHQPHLTYELPRRGSEVWTGEAEASEVTRDLVDIADEHGRLRAVMDAIRSNRVEEDFSSRWSAEREDFERKLYRKRNKVKVSFVEIDDSIPYFDDESQLDGDMLYRNMLSVVEPKDRRVVVCLHSGITGVKEIAAKLGYANHSPVSKALNRIRAKAAKWLA
jgi:hypothetical protein